MELMKKIDMLVKDYVVPTPPPEENKSPLSMMQSMRTTEKLAEVPHNCDVQTTETDIIANMKAAAKKFGWV